MSELTPTLSESPNGLPDFVKRETARAEFLTSGFVDRQIARLELAFPARMWRYDDAIDALCKMAVEFGEARTSGAITEAIQRGGRRDDGSHNSSFPPTIAELRNCVPAPRPRLRATDPACQYCRGTGWCSTPVGRVAVCSCRQIPEVA